MRKSQKNKEDYWISLSDMMTGLMVIFMFIAISYIAETQEKQLKKDELVEAYQSLKAELYKDLYQEFKEDFEQWQVSLDKDLTIKFKNPEVLFAANESKLTGHFKGVLNQFYPRYLEILLKDKYKDKIKEIRVEGHTDDKPTNRASENPYMDNLILSQERTASVVKHLQESKAFKAYSPQKQEWLLFHLTANGMSYGKKLDGEGKYVFNTNAQIDYRASRRVEFRIVTRSEEIIEAYLNL